MSMDGKMSPWRCWQAAQGSQALFAGFLEANGHVVRSNIATKPHVFTAEREENRCPTCGEHLIAPLHSHAAQWWPREVAPKDATLIAIKLVDTGEEIVVHFAEDMSGEEQPKFSGWFKSAGDDVSKGYVQVIEHWEWWRPLTDEERAADTSSLRGAEVRDLFARKDGQ